MLPRDQPPPGGGEATIELSVEEVVLNAGAIGKTLPFFGPRDTIQSHTSTSSFVATRRCFLDDGVNGFDERHCFRKQCRPPLPSSRDASKSTLGGTPVSAVSCCVFPPGPAIALVSCVMRTFEAESRPFLRS